MGAQYPSCEGGRRGEGGRRKQKDLTCPSDTAPPFGRMPKHRMTHSVFLLWSEIAERAGAFCQLMERSKNFLCQKSNLPHLFFPSWICVDHASPALGLFLQYAGKILISEISALEKVNFAFFAQISTRNMKQTVRDTVCPKKSWGTS